MIFVRVAFSLGIAIMTMAAGMACSASTDDEAGEDNSPSGGPILLVANKSDDTISWLDVNTGKILGVTTTGRGPHEIAITPDGKWAFVSNYEGPGDSISLIDVEKMSEVRKISIGSFRAPHGLVINRDGTKLYVTVENSRAVIEIDIATERVTRSFTTDQSVTHMLVLSPESDRVFTTSIGSGSGSMIDLSTGNPVRHLSTGEGAEGIDISPDGTQIWITNREADTVTIIDAATFEKIADLPATGFPIRVKFTPDGTRALVSAAEAGDVIVFDVSTRTIVKRISTGATPIGIVVEPNGARAFIANTQANTISVLDLQSLEISGRLAAGRTPDGMVLVP